VGELRIGALKSNGETKLKLAIDPNEEAVVIAACDYECGDLEISVVDKSGAVIDMAEPSGDGFILAADPSQPAGITLALRMLDCRKPSCAFGVGVFRRE
jgi:hypothetical protein